MVWHNLPQETDAHTNPLDPSAIMTTSLFPNSVSSAAQDQSSIPAFANSANTIQNAPLHSTHFANNDTSLLSWLTPDTFPSTGTFVMPLSFDSNDIHRSVSQPAVKRKPDAANLEIGSSSRDTLYAHEFLKAFRARMPNSTEGQAACDYCRRRKIKCDRKKPTCGHCAQSGRVCTNDDILRKRGPPSKRERALMDNAGIVFRGRNSRSSKYVSRRPASDKSAIDTPSSSLALANEHFATSMAKLEKGDLSLSNVPAMKNPSWPGSQTLWPGMAPPDQAMQNVPHSNANIATSNVPLSDHASSHHSLHSQTAMSMPFTHGLQQDGSLWNGSQGIDPANPSQFHMNMVATSSPLSRDTSNSFTPTSSLPGLSPSTMPGNSISPLSSILSTTGPPVSAPSMNNNTMNAGNTIADSMVSDLSLLTQPMGTSETTPKSDVSVTTRSPNVSGATTFSIAKNAIQGVSPRSGLNSLSTKHLLDFCITNGLAGTSVPSMNSAGSLLVASEQEEGSRSDAECIRVLDANGDLSLRPNQGYFASPAQLSRSCDLDLELPGGTSILASRLTNSSEDVSDLFLVQNQWDESDYAKLRADSVTRLQRAPSLTLIRIAIKDLSQSLPFLQLNELDNIVQMIVFSSNSSWTPLQIRQRQALLLMLCAVGSTLTPAIQITLESPARSATAVPWEFGNKCYRLARGLLAPRQGQIQPEEQSLVFVQCMILMHTYLHKCEDHASAWSALAYGVMACTQLLHVQSMQQPLHSPPVYCIVEREMIKRCVWVMFMQEVQNRIDNGRISPRSLITNRPSSLELPVLLKGLRMGDDDVDLNVDSSAFSRFVSHIELCQIFASIQSMLLDDINKAMKPEMKSVYDSLKVQLQCWESQSPCFSKMVSPSPTCAETKTWNGSQNLNGLPVYDICALYLTQFPMGNSPLHSSVA